MAKHKRKSGKRKTTHRAKRSGGACRGTPVKCVIKEGDGKPVLYCGKMRPILLKAGRNGSFTPIFKARPKKAKHSAITDPMAYEINADY